MASTHSIGFWFGAETPFDVDAANAAATMCCVEPRIGRKGTLADVHPEDGTGAGANAEDLKAGDQDSSGGLTEKQRLTKRLTPSKRKGGLEA